MIAGGRVSAGATVPHGCFKAQPMRLKRGLHEVGTGSDAVAGAPLPDCSGSAGHAPVRGYFETGRQRNTGDVAGQPAAGSAGARSCCWRWKLRQYAVPHHIDLSPAHLHLPTSAVTRGPSPPGFQRDAAVSADEAARLTRLMPILAGAVAANPNC